MGALFERQRLRRLAASFLAVLSICPILTQVACAAPAAPNPGYGFSLYGGNIRLSSDDLSRELDAVSRTNASWLRVIFDSFRIERQKGSFDWSYLDLVVNSARARSLNVLVVLSYSPEWARPPQSPFSAPPVNDGDFGDFAAAAATHYSDRVTNWEIWNEPNEQRFFDYEGDPVVKYTSLLKTAYSAIKRVQPNSTVISGGLSRSGQIAPPEFVERMYAAGAKGYFDATAMHPYVSPEGLAADPYNGWSDVGRVHTIMSIHGESGKRIWLTELGAPTFTGPGGVSQEEQAKQITEVLGAAASAGYVGPAFIFTIRDIGDYASDPEYSYGALLTADWQPKAAAAVLAR
jgi:polysaccharide biosynthesis protein PslG